MKMSVNSCFFFMRHLVLAIALTSVCICSSEVDNTLNWFKENNLLGDSSLPSDEELVRLVNASRLEENLRELSKEPHMSGTERARKVAEFVRDKFLEYGFDSARIDSYDALLSHPDVKNPNLVTLHNSTNHTVFTSKYKEDVVLPSDADPNFVHAFLAYTPAGTVRTKNGSGLVYANYGTAEDFEYLEKNSVNVSGKIVLARYGKIFRGNKILHAYQRGAIGAILFSDPNEVAAEGLDNVYPKSWWIPGSGIERGSAVIDDGDPLTPGWPSTDYAYRIPLKDAVLPKIPAQPIGYDDAKILLKMLGGPKAPADWQGGIPGVQYNIGPEFQKNYSGYSLRLSTHNIDKNFTIFNVIATLKGEKEPDRYVINGNHMDAWGYGAADPSSGTTQMLETARVLGTLKKEGWRPRRTLLMCAWDAEEYGLTGSTEFVEKNYEVLQERTVAYLNTDVCAGGTAFMADGSPHLWDLMKLVTRNVPGILPNSSNSLFEEWKNHSTKVNSNATAHPKMTTLGAGSDFAPFVHAGIPALDIYFQADRSKYNFSTYPSYHTAYETFFMISNLTDPGFLQQQACTRVSLLLLKKLLESPILPFNLTKFPLQMQSSLINMKDSGVREKVMAIDKNYELMEQMVNELVKNASDFMDKLHTRQYSGHSIFASSQYDYYASDAFPGITDLLQELDSKTKKAEKLEVNNLIKKHIMDLILFTERAGAFLHQFI